MNSENSTVVNQHLKQGMDEFNYDELFPSLDTNNVRKVCDEDFRDQDKKTIGDRIKIIDFSSVSHRTGRELDDTDFEELYDHDYFVVIETSQCVLFKTTHHEYKQDLIIAHPKTKKQYRVISGHVKLHIIK